MGARKLTRRDLQLRHQWALFALAVTPWPDEQELIEQARKARLQAKLAQRHRQRTLAVQADRNEALRPKYQARFSEQGRWFKATRMGRVLLVWQGGGVFSYAPREWAIELLNEEV